MRMYAHMHSTLLGDRVRKFDTKSYSVRGLTLPAVQNLIGC